MTLENSYKVLHFQGRELPVAYRGLIISRWCRSLKYGNDMFKLTEPKAYWAVYPKLVEFLLAQPQTTVSLAVLSDDTDVVLGFSVHEKEALHYVHVDKDQRGQGIGRALVNPTLTTVTHVTKQGIPFWAAVLPKAVFNPFRA